VRRLDAGKRALAKNLSTARGTCVAATDEGSGATALGGQHLHFLPG